MSVAYWAKTLRGAEKQSASPPLIHVTCRPRGTFFKAGWRGGGEVFTIRNRGAQIGVVFKGHSPQKLKGFRHLLTVRWTYFDTSFHLGSLSFFLVLFNILYTKSEGGSSPLSPAVLRTLTCRILDKHIFCLTVNLGFVIFQHTLNK